jgi:hypothetical protein
MRIPIFCLIFVTLGWGNLAAQTAAQSSEDRREAMLRTLLARVESLEAEVRQLKAEKSRRSTESSGKMASQAEPASMMDMPMRESEPTTSEQTAAQETYPQLKIRGFADIDYHLADRGADQNAFRYGQLDLCLTSQLAEDVSVMNENVLEPDEDNHFGFETERLLVQWAPRDYFNIAIGRYHTAIGYYNNAYHHGKWLQTAVGRPRIFNFEDEGGMLPIHNVGVTINGAIPSGRLGLHYVAEIGNGRNYNPGQEPVQNLSDNNDFKAMNVVVFARPDWLPGAQVGGSVYFDRVNIDGLPTADQTIFSAHAVYVSPAFEWLNEGVIMRDSSSLGTFQTNAFYTQLARQFGKFRPYLRYQLLDSDRDDPILGFTGSLGFSQILTLGARYNFSELAAIKLQCDHTFSADGGDPRNELTLQVSFTF